MSQAIGSDGFLLDTNVLSEGSKRSPPDGYLNWLEQVDDTVLDTSCLVINEGLRGVLLVKDSVQRNLLQAFWIEIVETFTGKTLPLDVEICSLWAILSADASIQGISAPYVDSLLVAQALHYNLTLVTRNSKDFEHFDDLITLNPWQ